MRCHAVEYAAGLAVHFKTPLALVNAYTVPLTGFDVAPPLDYVAKSAEISTSSLEETKQDLNVRFPELEIETYSRMGPPVDVINTVASELDAGLVVLGINSHAGAFKQNFIGSTAVDVAREGKTPAMVVPEEVKYNPIRRISFAWEMNSEEDFNLAYKVRYFCNSFSASLEIVNIETGKEAFALSHESKHEFLESRFGNVKHETLILDGTEPALALQEHFKSYPPDVVMIYPKKHGFFYSLTHTSTTSKLAFNTGRPLLVIH